MPHSALAAGKTAVSAAESKYSRQCRPAASSFAKPGLQQSAAKKAELEIVFLSQGVASDPQIAANLAAFASACPVFVAALRGA
jgi:hypothetical protein